MARRRPHEINSRRALASYLYAVRRSRRALPTPPGGDNWPRITEEDILHGYRKLVGKDLDNAAGSALNCPHGDKHTETIPEYPEIRRVEDDGPTVAGA